MTRAGGRAIALVFTSMLVLGTGACEASASAPALARGVLVVLVPGVSFEQLLAIPEVESLARSGGAALMSSRTPLLDLLQTAFPKTQVHPIPSATTDLHLTVLQQGFGQQPGSLTDLGRNVLRESAKFDVGELLLIVAGTSPSATMRGAKDELLPVVVARGSPATLFPSGGPMRTLTSSSTRRVGVVTDEDIVPTILDFAGRIPGNPIPSQLDGSRIDPVDAPVPFELHARHLANRRMSVPIQMAAGIYVTVAGLCAIALLALRGRVPARVGHSVGWLALTTPTLGAALLAAGHLPTLSYGTVVPFVVAVTIGGTLGCAPFKRRGVLGPPAAMGAAVLGYFVIEAIIGWTAALTPFLGGSELDGMRFYGLPNVFIGLLLGAALYVATRLRALVGFGLLVVTAFFAGLPGIGANLGGALAIFAAAGMWLALRRSGRLGWKELGFVLLVIVVGMAAVLAAHAFLTKSPTHGTRFLERSERSPSVIWRTFTERLLTGWRLIVRNPFGLVPVIGLPVSLLAVLRPPAPVREALERHREWRDALLVMLLASVVAYFVNDSGAAAAGLGFGLAVGGMLYVSLFEQTWKMKET